MEPESRLQSRFIGFKFNPWPITPKYLVDVDDPDRRKDMGRACVIRVAMDVLWLGPMRLRAAYASTGISADSGVDRGSAISRAHTQKTFL